MHFRFPSRRHFISYFSCNSILLPHSLFSTLLSPLLPHTRVSAPYSDLRTLHVSDTSAYPRWLFRSSAPFSFSLPLLIGHAAVDAVVADSVSLLGYGPYDSNHPVPALAKFNASIHVSCFDPTAVCTRRTPILGLLESLFFLVATLPSLNRLCNTTSPTYHFLFRGLDVALATCTCLTLARGRGRRYVSRIWCYRLF